MATMYTVQPGDTLKTIAAAQYPNGSAQWQDIYNANLDRIISPNELHAGQPIVLP